MSIEDRIQELLEELMDGEHTPEEACAQSPELLTEVRKRWIHLQCIEHQVGLFFPTSIRSAWGDSGSTGESGIRKLPRIDGYDVESLLGHGGMGVVYRARHLKLNRTVALKMLLHGAYAGPQELVRFQREAEAVASLSHANIVQIYDFGDLDGRPFFTMEFVEGTSLSEALSGVPQPAQKSAAFVAILALAVQVAHEEGIIHRDLKPANVLLTADGTPKITDFGLARRFEGESNLTMTGARIGTPSYMAPEQAAGLTSSIGPAADIYALGAILYEILTGRPPFRAETAIETERQVVDDEPVSPRRLNSKVPRDLETICLKCLQKDPGRRYASAVELADDLGRFLNGKPVRARPIGWLERIWRWGKRNQQFAAALSGIAGLMVLIVVGSLWAVAYFHKLERDQRQLAKEKGDLADQKGKLAVEKEKETEKALTATRRATELHRLSEEQGKELRRNLYLTEMNLAGQSATLIDGIGRAGGLLERWKDELPDLRNWEWYYLNGLTHRNLSTLVNHGKSVYHLAWSPNGERLAAASHDNTVCIWDGFDARPPVRLVGHKQLVFSVAWSPDGRRLASACWDRTVRIWDAASATELFCFQGHKDAVHSVAWSPDGTMLASGGAEHTILIWDADGGKIRQTLRGHEGKVARLSWSPVSKRLASASYDTTIRVWDITAGTELETLRGHTNWVNQVSWSPDGNRIASASNDETIRIWQKDRETRILRGHTRGVQSVDWSPDGTRLVSSSEDQTVRVWSIATGTDLLRLRGHSAVVTTVAWNPKNDTLASGGFERNIRIWSASAGLETTTLTDQTSPVTTLAWCPVDSKRCASAGESGEVKLRDMSRQSVDWSFRADEGPVKSVAWSPLGTQLATGGRSGQIRIWDIASKQKVQTLKGHDGDVYAVAWSLDGRRIASGGFDRKIRIWDVDTGTLLHLFENHTFIVYGVAWSPDGRKLASSSGDKTARIFDVETGKEVICYRGHRDHVVSVAWSPDGAKLATASHDQTVQLWDGLTGQRIAILRGHASATAQVVWSPDGQRVASAGREGNVKVWDHTAGREALTISGISAEVVTVAWSPDGLMLASASMDKRIHVHDATSGYLAGRAPQMLPLLERRLEANPSHTADRRLRIEIEATHHDWERAATHAREYVMLNPDRPWFMLDCAIAGPYAADPNEHCPPENEDYFGDKATTVADTEQTPRVNWKTVANSAQGVVDFGAFTEHANRVSAYALFPIFSPDDRQVAVLLRTETQPQLWLNGQRLDESLGRRTGSQVQHQIPVSLKSGWNSLLVRVANETGDHVLYLQLAKLPPDATPKQAK